MEPNGHISHRNAEDTGDRLIFKALKSENYYLPKANRKSCNPLVKFSLLGGVSNHLLRVRRWIGHQQYGIQVTIRKSGSVDMRNRAIVHDPIQKSALRRLIAE